MCITMQVITFKYSNLLKRTIQGWKICLCQGTYVRRCKNQWRYNLVGSINTFSSKMGFEKIRHCWIKKVQRSMAGLNERDTINKSWCQLQILNKEQIVSCYSKRNMITKKNCRYEHNTSLLFSSATALWESISVPLWPLKSQFASDLWRVSSLLTSEETVCIWPLKSKELSLVLKCKKSNFNWEV